MVLDKLILDNFLTYDHFEYEFEKKPLLIQGLNLTDDNQKTNGTGKSGIQTGIEFCITASNSRDVRDSELVTYGMSNGHTQLFASCDGRKESIHIDWTINVKGSNKLVLKLKKYNSEDWNGVSFSNVNDGKKYILNWFAISKEDLFNYFIINNSRFKSFFKSSNKEKVDLINRFSDASIIKGLENIDNSELEDSLRDAEKETNLTQGKIDLLRAQILNQNNRDFKAEMQDEVNELEDEIEYIGESIEGVENKINATNLNIKRIKEVDIITVKENIVIAHSDKADIDDEITSISNNITEISNELKRAKKLVDEFIITDWDDKRSGFEKESLKLNKSLIDQEKQKKETKEKETKLLEFIQSLNVKLGGTIICPACEHNFLLDEDLKGIQESKQKAEVLEITIKKMIAKNDELIVVAEKDIKEIQGWISVLNKKESSENSEKNKFVVTMNDVSKNLSVKQLKLKGLEQELKVWKADMDGYDTEIKNYEQDIENNETVIENYKTKINNFNTEIKSYRAKIKNLSVGNNEELINTLENDLSLLEEQSVLDRNKITSINDDIYERNQWIANFKQFRMYLANQSLEVIQYHCNRYLTDMGSDMKIKMEGFKVLANGNFKEEITAKVIREHERTFSSFSGGERGRLLFASILANRHMINDTHPYGGFDFLAIDEVFEGIDSLGLKNIMESAKTLGVPVMIITHVTDEEASSDRLLIVKENGISRIKKE